MIPSNLSENANSLKKSESKSRSNSSESVLSSRNILEPAPSGSKRKFLDEQSDSSLYLDASSDDEWEPSHLKGERKIDPDNIIDIKTAREPLFGPLKELPEISDFDEDEDDVSVISTDDVKKEIFATPSKEVENEIEDVQARSLYDFLDCKKSTGAIKKIPSVSRVKPINISRNQEAVRLIRKLVEYFTFHNSLPKREKEKYKHKLSNELMAVLSQVLEDCSNNIYEQILERVGSQQINSDKKVTTRNVACQTVITGDVLSSALLPKIDGKVNNLGVKMNDIEAVVELLNEHVAQMSVNSPLP